MCAPSERYGRGWQGGCENAGRGRLPCRARIYFKKYSCLLKQRGSSGKRHTWLSSSGMAVFQAAYVLPTNLMSSGGILGCGWHRLMPSRRAFEGGASRGTSSSSWGVLRSRCKARVCRGRQTGREAGGEGARRGRKRSRALSQAGAQLRAHLQHVGPCVDLPVVVLLAQQPNDGLRQRHLQREVQGIAQDRASPLLASRVSAIPRCTPA
jgi:hypothetical protein